jgi:hypothetical protein
LRDPHLHRVYRSIMLTSQRNISVNFNIPSFGQLFYSQSPLYGYLAQYLYSLFSCSTEHSKREKCYYIIWKEVADTEIATLIHRLQTYSQWLIHKFSLTITIGICNCKFPWIPIEFQAFMYIKTELLSEIVKK